MTTPPPSAHSPSGQPPSAHSPSGQPPWPGAQPAYPGYGAQPAAYGQPRPPRQPVQVWDVVLTIVFLTGLLVLTAFASFMGLFLVMGSDSCGVRDCSTELITIGWLVGTLLPWVVLIATAILSIVLMVKRKLAFYVPLLGAVGVGASLVLGFVIVSAGVPTS